MMPRDQNRQRHQHQCRNQTAPPPSILAQNFEFDPVQALFEPLLRFDMTSTTGSSRSFFRHDYLPPNAFDM